MIRVWWLMLIMLILVAIADIIEIHYLRKRNNKQKREVDKDKNIKYEEYVD